MIVLMGIIFWCGVGLLVLRTKRNLGMLINLLYGDKCYKVAYGMVITAILLWPIVLFLS